MMASNDGGTQTIEYVIKNQSIIFASNLSCSDIATKCNTNSGHARLKAFLIRKASVDCLSMADILTTPHDRFTKANLQEVAIARAFLKVHLDVDLRKRIDLSSMKLTNNEFVLPHLRKIQSDVVYECLIDGKNSYIYFLMEGQSSAEELMAFRKLQYNVALMDHHLKMGNKKLPVIVSICL